MATGIRYFDISPCFGTDVPGWYASEKEQKTTQFVTNGSEGSFVLNVISRILEIGRDNILNFNSVDYWR